MIPPLSRLSIIVLAGSLLTVWPLMEGCAHSTHASAMPGGAPGLLQEDAPHTRGGTNPNAPYLMAATSPQLVKRSEATASTTANPCESKDLAVTEIAAAVNGNYRAVKLAFDNEGLVPCHIGGYPAISLLDNSGTPVASLIVDRVTASTLNAQLAEGPARTAASKPDAQITIAPKGEAWFQVGWSTGQGCPIVSRIDISAPGSTESFAVNHPMAVCEGHVQITTLQPDQDSD
jgi:Protein of unknown function (DUF4232)